MCLSLKLNTNSKHNALDRCREKLSFNKLLVSWVFTLVFTPSSATSLLKLSLFHKTTLRVFHLAAYIDKAHAVSLFKNIKHLKKETIYIRTTTERGVR